MSLNGVKSGLNPLEWYNSREVFPIEKASGFISLYILKYSPTGFEFSGEKEIFQQLFHQVKLQWPNELLDIQKTLKLYKIKN